MTAVALMGRETSRIELGTAVVPLQSRHPVALGQQALSVQAACDGRFRLGVGPSHHWIIDSMLGLPYEQAREAGRELPRRVRRDVRRARARSTSRTSSFRIHNPLDVTDLPVPVLPRRARAGDAAAGGRAGRGHGPLDGRRACDRRARRPEDHQGGGRRRSARAASRRGRRGVPVRAGRGRGRDRARQRRRSATPSTRRTTSACWSRAASDDVGDMSAIGTEADIERATAVVPRRRDRPTSRPASCRWAAARTRSSRRRGARASSSPPSRPSSREHVTAEPTRGDLLWPSIPAMALDAAARFGDAVAVIDRGRRISVHGARRRRASGDRRAARRRDSSRASAPRSGRPTGTSGSSPRSASSAQAARSCR